MHEIVTTSNSWFCVFPSSPSYIFSELNSKESAKQGVLEKFPIKLYLQIYVLTMSTARRLVTTCRTERQEALALVLHSVQWTVTSVGIVPEPSGSRRVSWLILNLQKCCPC